MREKFVNVKFALDKRSLHNSEIEITGNYLGLITRKQYLLWVGAYGLQRGIWAGCLSVAAQFFSLYVSNKLLVLAIPIFVDQMFTELWHGAFQRILNVFFNPLAIFDASYNFFGSTWKMVLCAVGVGAAFAAAIGTASYFKIRKRM